MPVSSATSNKLFKSAKESEKPEISKINGSLPQWLKGSYLRVGPAKFDFQDEFTVSHWLDGYALLSRFEIQSIAIIFEKKYLQSDAYKRSLAANRPVINEFGTPAHKDPSKGFFSRMISNLLPEFTDNNYSTLFKINSDMFATCDTCFFRKVDSATLDSDEKCDSNKLFGLNGVSAHPLTDINGDMYNVGYSLFPSAKYSIIKMAKGNSSKEMLKKAKIIATIPSQWSGALAINHSFGMTSNYIVYVEQPFVVTLSKIAQSVMKGETLKDVLEWRPQEKNRFYIIEKSTGKVFKTEILAAQAFYFMHFVNCFEQNDQIVVDIVTYKSPNMIGTLDMHNLRNNLNKPGLTDLSCVQRFILPTTTDTKAMEEGVNVLNDTSGCSAFRQGNRIIVKPCDMTSQGLEMPIINPKFQGKKIRYVYTAGGFNKCDMSSSICKTDMDTRESVLWKENEHLCAGEPYFIPRPDGDSEDDGIVISALTDTREGHDDYLLFLDAKNFQEIARSKFKSHVPAALHGIFLPK